MAHGSKLQLTMNSVHLMVALINVAYAFRLRGRAGVPNAQETVLEKH